MKNFHRDNPFFSLCGLNCGLCTLHIGGYCPGCGGGEGNQSCALARCGTAHGVDYCFRCGDYPCEKYAGFAQYDSFIPGRNRQADIEKAKRIGMDAYMAEQNEKIALLRELLAGYNDGRRKTLFATAVYLLELPDLRDVMGRLRAQTSPETPDKERAETAARLLRDVAAVRNVDLKLHKKPKQK